MKFKKLTYVCAAALLVGCLSAPAYAAYAGPLPSVDGQAVATDLPSDTENNHITMLNEIVSVPGQEDASGEMPAAATPGAAEQGSAEGNGEGFMAWYMNLFNSPAFVISFVGVIAIIALVLFKIGPRKPYTKKSGNKSSNHRTDGL